MRDANRLYPFYNKLAEIHIKHFPDWRFGQFIDNFRRWMQYKKHIDIFFPEEEELSKLLDEFVEVM